MKSSGKASYILIPAIVMLFNVLIIIFPKDTIEASRNGLTLWFNNVLPSLLPFIIGTNILMSLGAVNFLGTLLEPIMYPLFGVPGCGGFGLAIGLMSGYPMGAKVAAELRERGEITKAQAQRLIGFSNNSGPLFVLGAVAAGMFANISAGYFILLIHFLSAIILGLLTKNFYGEKSSGYVPPPKRLFYRAYRSMIGARLKDKRTMGELLSASVSKSMETILLIGGFIILFCVLSKALEILGFFDMLCSVTAPLATFFGIPREVLKGIFIGVIEMTNGVREISLLGGSRAGFIAAAAIISWGGLSIHAQTISFISKTDISAVKYLVSKAAHSILTAVIGFLLYPFFEKKLAHSVPVSVVHGGGFGRNLMFSLAFFGVTILCLIILPIIISLQQRMKLGPKPKKKIKPGKFFRPGRF